MDVKDTKEAAMNIFKKSFKKITKEKVVLWIVLLLVLSINTFRVANTEQINYDSGMGLTVYYYMQATGIYIWFYLIICFIIPNIYSADILKKKNNRYHYFEITRIGYRNYCTRNFLTNSVITFFSTLFIHIYLLFLIHFFISPIKAGTMDAIGIYVGLNANIIVNLIMYIIFSSIGCMVFSNFILSLQLYIKNIYIYRALGICLGIMLFLLPAFLSRICGMLLQSKVLSTIFGIFFIPNIIIPSLESNSVYGISPLIGYILTLIFYSIITLIIFRYKNRKEHVYE